MLTLLPALSLIDGWVLSSDAFQRMHWFASLMSADAGGDDDEVIVEDDEEDDDEEDDDEDEDEETDEEDGEGETE